MHNGVKKSRTACVIIISEHKRTPGSLIPTSRHRNGVHELQPSVDCSCPRFPLLQHHLLAPSSPQHGLRNPRHRRLPPSSPPQLTRPRASTPPPSPAPPPPPPLLPPAPHAPPALPLTPAAAASQRSSPLSAPASSPPPFPSRPPRPPPSLPSRVRRRCLQPPKAFTPTTRPLPSPLASRRSRAVCRHGACRSILAVHRRRGTGNRQYGLVRLRPTGEGWKGRHREREAEAANQAEGGQGREYDCPGRQETSPYVHVSVDVVDFSKRFVVATHPA
ncbi:hypothetical protein BDK51DRAFT_49636 [Blyttiomyces helicus]|uniref:Uncharacterized protein n=1 Tax=Blyttiomyces helicus TaxID=388810 RepID=A0A4P9VYH6_9FUNG|nr:hypothetical protein BDK51DRAFT_49636 [Blyttiomyces helicus]|eukprot:RKO83813.1 hypothetical protein BDK51DRAFT_49636 [Blyttiomyces helicus]